jgi:hypothetical protein
MRLVVADGVGHWYICTNVTGESQVPTHWNLPQSGYRD